LSLRHFVQSDKSKVPYYFVFVQTPNTSLAASAGGLAQIGASRLIHQHEKLFK